MGERTCKIVACGRKYFSRDLCSHHYGAAYRRGELRQPALPLDRHSLQSVDREAKIAHCSICGPNARVRLRANGRAECQGKRPRSGTRRRRGEPPLPRRNTSRESHLVGTYGISQRDYDHILADQGGSCAICRVPVEHLLRVDHCHETGRVRGLLCNRCNIGLGWFRDDPVRIARAAAYLQR